MPQAFAQKLPPATENHIRNFSDAEKIEYLGKQCWELREKSNEEAILYGRYAVSLADSLKLYSAAAEISNFLGVAMLYYIYDTQKAWEHFRDALNYSIISNDSIQLGFANDNLGYMYLIHGDLDRALEHESTAEKIFIQQDFESGIAYVSDNLGLIQQKKGNYDRAFYYFRKAHDILEKHQNETGLAAVLSCMGETFILTNHPDSALQCFNRQLELSEKHGHQRYLALALKGIGSVYDAQGDYAKALEMIDRAIGLMEEKNDFYELAKVRIFRALVLAKLNRADEGEKELHEALALASKLRLPETIYDIYQGFVDFYRLTGYTQNLSINFSRIFEMYDSVFNEHQAQTITNENQKFRINQNLAEARAQIELEKQKKKWFYLIIVLIVVVSLIHYWRYRKYKELGKKLKLKNREVNVENHSKLRALKALEKSEKELKQSNEAKDKLFSIIAHDLRSPFNSLVGFSQVLYENSDALDNTEKKEMARIIHESSKQGLDLLDNLLLWSHTQTRGIKFSPETIELTPVIEQNIRLKQGMARKKNISLKFSNGVYYHARADKEMLDIILRNLISNAIKFTPENGAVTVSIKKEHENAGVVTISVEDNGIGIPEEELGQLFEIRKSKTSYGTNNEPGTGLGLLLCKEFAEKQGGTIGVESQPGKGSRFTITLPAGN